MLIRLNRTYCYEVLIRFISIYCYGSVEDWKCSLYKRGLDYVVSKLCNQSTTLYQILSLV